MRYLSYICRCKSVIIHFQPYYNNDEQRIDSHSDDVFRRVCQDGWYYLLTFIPILGALFLLYFFVSDSAPEENRYGKSPKYAQETF